ncbi:hydroxypyruvate isomerase family protein [Microvirga terrestris]|uniref:TIM barrel protein n=1 Tax=Microvirga terrestris TaxID=2791024 RepID=A0ABS0HX48_9HYPH|nr:TIM barrel protein [Microvirga terrestris]MBF9198063.1 TIM barrel protein [Microvirga terrestris]
MPRFSANLGFLFSDRPDIQRVAAAAACGFKAVEMHWPYHVPALDMREALAAHNLTMLGLNMPVGDTPADLGLGAIPGRESAFQHALDQALSYGSTIQASAIHCLAGIVSSDNLASAERIFIANLQMAADRAGQVGMTILIEPMNHRDRPGYFLRYVEQAAAIVGQAGRRNIKLMFDCYHVQITQGDLITRLRTHLDLIGHVQIAAVPSRMEPDEGEVSYREIFRTLDNLGYQGWVGAEYKPRGRTEDGLGWLSELSGKP